MWHYELAGEEAPDNWSSRARDLLEATAANVQWTELYDSAQHRYRAARFGGERLDGCIFISPDFQLPERDWLIKLFSKEALDRSERIRVLAGTPAAGQEDAGRIICSCFSVGRNKLLKAIRDQGMDTPEKLGALLQAGTNCGSCVPELRALIEESGS